MISIITDDDLDKFINKYDVQFKNTIHELLNKMSKKRLVSRSQKVLDIMEFLYVESIKKMQDDITKMITDFDNFFSGVNIGRFNAQFNEMIQSESSKIMLSKIAIPFSKNVADRVKVTRGKTNELLYKLSQLEYNSAMYDDLFMS